MICSQCGKIVPDGSNVCPYCGNDINAAEPNNNQQQFGDYQEQSNFNQQQNNYQQARWVPVKKEEYFKTLFVSEDEKVVSLVGSSYLRNFLATGTLTNGYCALTDKRLYFKGKLYRIFGKKAIKRNIEEIIDVQEINSSGIEFIKRLGLFYCSIIFMVLTVFFLIVATDTESSNTAVAFLAIGAVTAITDIVFWILYALLRKKIFWVEYAGGSLAFSAASYDINEILKFQKCIHMTKENYNKSMNNVSKKNF